MDYNSMKVTELKEELKKRNIPTTKLSRKQDIIDRLIEDDNTATTDEGPVLADATQDAAEEEAGDPAIADETAVEANGVSTEQPDARAEADAAEVVEPEQTGAMEDIQTTAQEIDASAAVSEESSGLPPAEEKKRKRRSTSPAPSDSSISKKLKQVDEDPVIIQEEAVAVDTAPVPAPAEKDSSSPTQRRYKDLISPAAVRPDPEPMQEDTETEVEPPVHPVTSALYIRDLLRPLNSAQLKSHLESLSGAAPGSNPIQAFHLDSLRTHALVQFDSPSLASRVRAGLHNKTFPPEPTRKPLWVDYIPEAQLSSFIETEESASGTRPSQSKRWEVTYTTSASGTVTATLTDLTSQQPAPSAPHPQQPPTPAAPTKAAADDTAAAAPAAVLSTLPLSDLDAAFPSTTAAPKIYYLPSSPTLVSARLATLAEHTDPGWSARADHAKFGSSTTGGGAGRGLDQLRRYTFQDGAELVDGGAEFGGGKAFGRERGGFGGGYGGRGGFGGERGDRGGGMDRMDGGRAAGAGVVAGRDRGGVPRGGDRYRGAGEDGPYGGRGYGGYERGYGREYGGGGGGGGYGGGYGGGGGRGGYGGADRYADYPSGGRPYPSGGGRGGYRDRGGYGYPPEDREWVRDRY